MLVMKMFYCTTLASMAFSTLVLFLNYTKLLTGASVKVIQLLQHFEQLPSVFAQAVFVWSTEYGVRAIIGEVIRSVHNFYFK